MRLSWVVCLALSSSLAVAEPWDVAPPPRGTWIVDHTGTLSAKALENVNNVAIALDAAGYAQLGVLVTSTTSGIRPRDFATGVFNSWGVGHAGVNDGVLLFIAVADRKAEIILGDGSKIPTSATDAVMRNQVVANMKRGNLEAAVLTATLALVEQARLAGGAEPFVPEGTAIDPTPRPPPLDEALNAYAEGRTHFPERSPRTWVVDVGGRLSNSERARLDVAASDVYASSKGRIFFLVVESTAHQPSLEELTRRFVTQVQPLSSLPLAVVALDLSGPRTYLHVPAEKVQTSWDVQQVSSANLRLSADASRDRVAALIEAQRFAQLVIEAGVPPRPMSDVLSEGLERNKTPLQFGGGGVLVGLALLLRRWNRKRVRTCEKCQQPRLLLDEVADDAHLQSAQKTEESIGSVDYDVWWCERCHDPLVLRYGAWFSGYSSCPQCRAETKSSTSTTLSRATEYSTGSERVDERCQHCSFTNSFTRTIPRIQKTSSSSSSSRSSFSSSSSRSSFGGGSSSGRGSSGSW